MFALYALLLITDVGGFSFKRESLPSRPVVRLYTATWCSPCHGVKDDIKAARKAGLLPFDVDLVDVSNGGHPEWCDTIPAFAWDVNGQAYYVQDYQSVDILVRRWRASQKSKARSPP